MNIRKVLLILAVLLTLPFALRVRAEDHIHDSTMNSNWILADWESLTMPDDSVSIPPETFVVYYIDTVGFEKHKKTVQVSCPEHRIGCLVLHYGDIEWWAPIIDTIIVARFWIDHETKRIRDWRVRITK